MSASKKVGALKLLFGSMGLPAATMGDHQFTEERRCKGLRKYLFLVENPGTE